MRDGIIEIQGVEGETERRMRPHSLAIWTWRESAVIIKLTETKSKAPTFNGIQTSKDGDLAYGLDAHEFVS